MRKTMRRANRGKGNIQWDDKEHRYRAEIYLGRDEDGRKIRKRFVGPRGIKSDDAFLGLRDLRTQDAYVIDCERIRGVDFWTLRNQFVLHPDRNSPNVVVIEDAMAGGRLGGDISRSTRYPIRMVKPKTSKVERALQVIGQVEGHKVHLPAKAMWRDMLVQELSQFGAGCRYSDLTDALVWALLTARQYAMARREDQHWARQLEGFSLFR